jgi:hypothetical protein
MNPYVLCAKGKSWLEIPIPIWIWNRRLKFFLNILIRCHFYNTKFLYLLFPSVFATTAANSNESSYACYYDKDRNTFLGDVYSVMWMENAEQVRGYGSDSRNIKYKIAACPIPHKK